MDEHLTMILAAMTVLGGAAPGPATRGLVLHLDAEAQVRAGGSGLANKVWRNLAGSPDAVAGDGTLRSFRFDRASGWVGSGAPGDPFALRFDGERSYVLGPGNLELPALTLEAWALVEGCKGQPTQRAATLIGNDFGLGGISLMVNPATASPLLLHERTFTPVGAETPPNEWHQVVVTTADGLARLYVDGELQAALEAPRPLQAGHHPAYQLGVARRPDNDFVEADGLIGCLAIVRAYDRALSAAEVRANFEADRARFDIAARPQAREPVRAAPLPAVPGLGPAAPARCLKWDYYEHPLRVSAAGAQGWPHGARQAFDGYPTSMAQPYSRNYWRVDAPTPERPAVVTLDYRRPVAVTRFVHTFERFRTPCAWESVEVLTSDDQETWTLRQRFTGLPPDCPQVLGIDQPAAARYYRIVVKALAPGAPALASHEVETYYGATLGNVEVTAAAVQSEACRLSVRVVSPDAPLRGATLRLMAPKGSLQGPNEVPVPAVAAGGSAVAQVAVTPLAAGRIPLRLELHAGGCLIDSRPYTLHVAPKLVFRDLTPGGATVTAAGRTVQLRGQIANAGISRASGVQVAWMGQQTELGDLAPGQSAAFSLSCTARSGYHPGEVTATAGGTTKSVLRRAVLCERRRSAPASSSLPCRLEAADGAVRMAFPVEGVAGTLRLFTGGKPCALVPVPAGRGGPTFAAAVPGAVLLVRAGRARAGSPDLALRCSAIPDDPHPDAAPFLDVELRLAVDRPEVMFRPHIDWYTAEQGPNVAGAFNAHHSATRMLCVQTRGATLSLVPDTDNLVWGFTPDHQMTAAFQIPLAEHDPLGEGIWRPIQEAPAEFSLTLPVRKGDWWEAYRYVVAELFRFEQPRQWAMPITQMQMLSARYTMRSEVWSERWQSVRSHPGFDFFYNFYGTTYTLPTLYSWYLATDDATAREKAEKVLEWLLNLQERDGPAAGAWFSQYCVESSPPELVGRDQAWNRWVMPHATATAAKTLLWYWEASGRRNRRVLESARRACDWLVATQRPDGGWPYALDLQAKPITDLADAGQIWCTWALWKGHQLIGDARYKDAALRSRDYFRKAFMDRHRYEGYWEDVSGAGGKVARSWEGYEPAIAVLAFADMGEKELALAAAKDAATWSWTRVTSTRQYETSYGETTEQSLCGPSQAQSPMTGVGLQRAYELTGDPLWSDFSGAIKAVNFCADPDQAYGMVATGGWDDPTTAVIGPPYDGVRPFVTPNNSRGDEYGRQVWNEWCTNQFAWLALEWLLREANLRAPDHVQVDLTTLRGTVLGALGRVKMPEERCDVSGIEHHDINWVGCQNDDRYLLMVMNHKERTRVLVRPREAHLGVFCRPPRILVGTGRSYQEVKPVRQGEHTQVTIPEKANALLIWERMQ